LLDGTLRRWIDPLTDRVAGTLAAWGLRADTITIAGFLVGTGAWAALAFAQYPLALVILVINRVMDGLDGAVARRLGPTDVGGYLDIVLDFFFYAGVPFFFAVGRPEDALPAAFLVFSFVGSGSSFLAYAIFAAKRGQTTERQGRKSIYYLGGLTEGAETIAVFVAICLFPAWFAVLAWVFGALCWLTALGRVLAARSAFRESNQ
jgi:phosphatidylglycerophosphate synthase